VDPGHAHPEIFESRLSEMPFPELWGKILQNSDGQKMALLLYSLSLGAVSTNPLIADLFCDCFNPLFPSPIADQSNNFLFRKVSFCPDYFVLADSRLTPSPGFELEACYLQFENNLQIFDVWQKQCIKFYIKG
jgi:hypothetical protein